MNLTAIMLGTGFLLLLILFALILILLQEDNSPKQSPKKVKEDIRKIKKQIDDQ